VSELATMLKALSVTGNAWSQPPLLTGREFIHETKVHPLQRYHPMMITE
jgi:hypothetical protein